MLSDHNFLASGKKLQKREIGVSNYQASTFQYLNLLSKRYSLFGIFHGYKKNVPLGTLF